MACSRSTITTLFARVVSKLTHIERHDCEALSHHFNIISFSNLSCICSLQPLPFKSLPLLVGNSLKDTLVDFWLYLPCSLRKNHCIIVISIDGLSVTLLNGAPIFMCLVFKINEPLENFNGNFVIKNWPCSPIFNSKGAINL